MSAADAQLAMDASQERAAKRDTDATASDKGKGPMDLELFEEEKAVATAKATSLTGAEDKAARDKVLKELAAAEAVAAVGKTAPPTLTANKILDRSSDAGALPAEPSAPSSAKADLRKALVTSLASKPVLLRTGDSSQCFECPCRGCTNINSRQQTFCIQVKY